MTATANSNKFPLILGPIFTLLAEAAHRSIYLAICLCMWCVSQQSLSVALCHALLCPLTSCIACLFLGISSSSYSCSVALANYNAQQAQANRTQYQNEAHWFFPSCRSGLKSFSHFRCALYRHRPAKIFLARKTQFVCDCGVFCYSIIEFCPFYFTLSTSFYCSLRAVLINVNVSDFRSYCQHFCCWIF